MSEETSYEPVDLETFNHRYLRFCRALNIDARWLFQRRENGDMKSVDIKGWTHSPWTAAFTAWNEAGLRLFSELHKLPRHSPELDTLLKSGEFDTWQRTLVHEAQTYARDHCRWRCVKTICAYMSPYWDLIPLVRVTIQLEPQSVLETGGRQLRYETVEET